MTATATPRPPGRAAARASWAEGLRRRPALVAALLSLAISAVMVGPALLPGRALSTADLWWFAPPWAAERPAELVKPANPDLRDAAQQMHPLREEVVNQLPGAPLWNPWIAGGRPLLADAQSAVLSPFTLPAYVLPLQTSLAWTALLTLWAATFGMYGLGRALGMRFAGALMAGLVYGQSLWLVSHLSYPHSGVWALLPWMLWATERLVRRPDAASVALLAGAVGLQYLAGHPESSFHVLLATVAFFVLRVALGRRGTDPAVPSVRGPLLAMGAALAAGTALAAIMLVPFLELLFGSADLAERSGTGVDSHIDPTYLLGFFLYDWWGRATETPVTPLLFSRAWYAGALPLVLAAAALIVRPRAERLWIAGAGAVLVAVIFGLPPFLQVFTRLPLLSSGHNDRLIVVTLACLALLAGWGLDELASRGRLPRRGALLAAGVVVLVLPLVMVVARGDIGELFPGDALEVATSLASPPPFGDARAADVVRLASVELWIVLAGAALLLLALRLRGRGVAPPVFAGLALALVAADLLRAGMGYNPAIAKEDAEQPVTGALTALMEREHTRFAGLGTIPQNVPAIRHRLQDARGYDLPIPERYNRLWRRELSPEYPDQTSTLVSIFLQIPKLDERRLRTLRLLGVSDLLAPPSPEPPTPAELEPLGLRPVYEGPDARVIRVEGALPRTFVAGAQETVDGDEAALDAVTRPGFDPLRTVVTERALPGIPAGGGVPGAGRARVTSYAADEVTIEADLARRGVVVLGDNFYPGWKAEVDGEPADVEQVDYVLRGVVAGPGRHTVRFFYEPLSWRIGWIVTLLTLLGLGAAVVVSRRRRRGAAAGGARDGRAGAA